MSGHFDVGVFVISFLITFAIFLAISIAFGNQVRKAERRQICKKIIDGAANGILFSSNPYQACERLNCIDCIATVKERCNLEKFLGRDDFRRYREISYYLGLAERGGPNNTPLIPEEELAQALKDVWKERLDTEEDFSPLQTLIKIVEARQKEVPLQETGA